MDKDGNDILPTIPFVNGVFGDVLNKTEVYESFRNEEDFSFLGWGIFDTLNRTE